MRRSRGLMRGAVALAVLAALVAASGCSASADTDTGTGDDVSELTVTSQAFGEGETIPAEFTCAGGGAFPGIAWTGDLAGATAFAVVVDDPDAPCGTFTHLVVLDLPATTTSLDDPAAAGGTSALNSAGATGWTPPCPPSGEHHYRFTVYGLSAPTGLDPTADPVTATAAIDELTVSQGTLTGLVAAS